MKKILLTATAIIGLSLSLPLEYDENEVAVQALPVKTVEVKKRKTLPEVKKAIVLPKVDVASLSKVQKREVECLAINLYREARGEPLEGILAVAFVTINRVLHEKFPSSVCKVVYQKNSDGCQFSWTCKRRLKPVNKTTYEKLKYVAASIYINKHSIEDPSKGALFYHADYVDPYWRKVFTKTEKIGRHIFYKK